MTMRHVLRLGVCGILLALCSSFLSGTPAQAAAAASESKTSSPAVSKGADDDPAPVPASQTSTTATTAMLAGGSFEYGFTGKCCINTREFSTSVEANVYISVRNMSPCNYMSGSGYGDGRVDVKMQLFQNDFAGDTKIGGDKFIVDCAGTVSWSQVNPRNRLYIKMTILYPHRDSRTYSWSGKVAYDGSTA